MITLLDKTKVYAGRLKDPERLIASSSGGAFTALSDVFLVKGYAVACAVYDYNQKKVIYKLLTSPEERNMARGSKYIQSLPGNIFAECKSWLDQNPDKELLFVGLGCQAEGFRKFAEMKGIRSRVYIVDLICHGSASPLIWSQYAQSLEDRYGGQIEFLTFRDKRKGWPTAAVVINGKRIPIKKYMKVYYNRCISRPSCHVCPFATTERQVDITIGDFWHLEEKIPDFYDANGTSVILLHTNHGYELFEEIMNSMDYRECNTSDCWQLNLEHPTPMFENRSAFWKDYKEHGANYIMKKYGTTTLREKIMYRIKKLEGGGT